MEDIWQEPMGTLQEALNNLDPRDVPTRRAVLTLLAGWILRNESENKVAPVPTEALPTESRRLFFRLQFAEISTFAGIKEIFYEYFPAQAEDYFTAFQTAFTEITLLFSQGGIIEQNGNVLRHGLDGNILSEYLDSLLTEDTDTLANHLKKHGIVKCRSATLKKHGIDTKSTFVFVIAPDIITHLSLEQRGRQKSPRIAYKKIIMQKLYAHNAPFDDGGAIPAIIRSKFTEVDFTPVYLPPSQALCFIVNLLIKTWPGGESLI